MRFDGNRARVFSSFGVTSLLLKQFFSYEDLQLPVPGLLLDIPFHEHFSTIVAPSQRCLFRAVNLFQHRHSYTFYWVNARSFHLCVMTVLVVYSHEFYSIIVAIGSFFPSQRHSARAKFSQRRDTRSLLSNTFRVFSCCYYLGMKSVAPDIGGQTSSS